MSTKTKKAPVVESPPAKAVVPIGERHQRSVSIVVEQAALAIAGAIGGKFSIARIVAVTGLSEAAVKDHVDYMSNVHPRHRLARQRASIGKNGEYTLLGVMTPHRRDDGLDPVATAIARFAKPVKPAKRSTKK